MFQVTNKDLVVNRCTQLTRLKEVNTVQVGDVDAACIGQGTFRAIFLYVHAKETNILSINFFKCKHGFGTVRK